MTLSGPRVWRLRYYSGTVKLLLSPGKAGGLPYGNYGLGHLEGREEGREEGRVEGREEGRVEGKIEGRVEGKIEVGRRLIEKGTPIEEAAEIVGVSVELLTSRSDAK